MARAASRRRSSPVKRRTAPKRRSSPKRRSAPVKRRSVTKRRSSPKRQVRRAPMKRMDTECSKLSVRDCNKVNPSCGVKRAPGRKTKICVRKSGAATKGAVYQGPSMSA